MVSCWKSCLIQEENTWENWACAPLWLSLRAAHTQLLQKQQRNTALTAHRTPQLCLQYFPCQHSGWALVSALGWRGEHRSMHRCWRCIIAFSQWGDRSVLGCRVRGIALPQQAAIKDVLRDLIAQLLHIRAWIHHLRQPQPPTTQVWCACEVHLPWGLHKAGCISARLHAPGAKHVHHDLADLSELGMPHMSEPIARLFD